MNQQQIKAKVDAFITGFCDIEKPPIPFPVADLAEYHELSVMSFSPRENPHLKDICGIVNYADKAIYISNDGSTGRQKFTIAHELGHVALHNDGKNVVDYRNNIFSSDRKEQEANAFAAELLMPENFFRKVYKESGGLAFTLAEKFSVSTMAATYRIKNLGLTD